MFIEKLLVYQYISVPSNTCSVIMINSSHSYLSVCDAVSLSYPCRWGGVHDGKPYVAGLEMFAERVLNNLWNAVKKFYPPEVSQRVHK